MKLLTKNTDYAIRALLELGAHPDQYLSARWISDRQDIPYQYLRKILHTLIKEGLVASREGLSGGFKMNTAPQKIKLIDAIQIFQGNFQLSECLFRKKICPNRPRCVLRKQLLEIEDAVAQKFSALTIAKLLKQTV